MSLHEPAIPEDEDKAGRSTHADRRMADILGDKNQTRSARECLRDEGSEDAEDLIGRLNAMDFIDDVIGDEVQMPSKIGDFEITGVLGRGGMGTVYQAYQENLDREVALKVLAPRFSSDVTMRTRFRKEAKATAAMHHRHIVPIFDYGEASGHMFFAMERVDGVSLDKHVSAARRNKTVAMEPLDAARRFAGVADALALAHSRKILHRDVKPANVLVHGDGTLALADFGLSKFLGEASVHLTSVGGFLGTLHYSPPEQARGEALGPASDLYSLGVTIFECITGHLPLDGDSTEAMLHALLNEEAPRLRHHLPKVSRDLEAVMEKLLTKRPEERYQDGEALALDLMRVAEGEPVRIRRQSVAVRLYRRAKRKPLVTLAVGAGLILLIVLVLYFQSVQSNTVLEGRENLANAAGEASQERGLALGPHGVLKALSGLGFAETSEASAVLDQLARAEKRLPDQTAKIEGYREAYRGAVLTQNKLLQLLTQGNGKTAVARLTPLIKERSGRIIRDVGVQLDLYNLHLVRAMAYLTASVGNPAEALSDLKIAKYIRPGAFLPQILLEFLENRAEPGELVAALDDCIKRLKVKTIEDARHRRAAAQLLIAFAGIGSPSTAHLMSFSLKYEMRRQLTVTALGWMGGDVAFQVEDNGGYKGLGLSLANEAIKILNESGKGVLVEKSKATAREIFSTMLEPGSELVSWRFTYQLLGGDRVPDGVLDEEQKRRGGIHFIKLVQAVMPADEGDRLLHGLSALIRPLLGDPQRDTGAAAVELRARYESLTGQTKNAVAAVDAWLQLDETNPDAHLCAFCARVRQAPKTEQEMIDAMTPGSEALQLALDRNRMNDLLRRRLDAQLRQPALGAEARKWLKSMDEFLRLAVKDG